MTPALRWWELFLPPAAFASEATEEAFLDDYGKRSAGLRKVAMILALATWISYIGWDFFHYNASQFLFGGAAVLERVLVLRMIGVVFVATIVGLLMLRYFEDERRATWLLAAAALGTYSILLQMIEAVPFPYNYLYYYIGLLLVLLILFGFLRVRARPVIVISALCLVLSAHSFSNVQARHVAEDSYWWAAMSFLISFVVIGCAIAAGLERAAREAFFRERTLADSYRALERLRAETEVSTAALLATKEAMRQRAEEQNREKSKFVSAAAHDLRQPIQALGNFLDVAEMALTRSDYATCAHSVSAAKQAGMALSEGINAVLDLSRLETGFVKPDYSEFDVATLIDDVLRASQSAAAINHVELRVFCDRSRARVVRSDRLLLRQVLSNLVGNAIKYADQGGRRHSTIIVGVVKLTSRIRVDVVDNGVGIAREHWENIFKPFYQINNNERDREKGLGLGLAIVNGVVNILEGHRLEMKSRPGRGTRFSIDVPLANPDHVVSPALMPDSGVELPSLKGIFALYFEDDRAVRQSTVALFKEYGIICESAASVEEAERVITSLEMAPDIVVTDYRLIGGRTASEILLVLRRCEVTAPVIVMTGEAVALEELPGLDGATRLRKPVAPVRLLQEIARLTSPQRASES